MWHFRIIFLIIYFQTIVSLASIDSMTFLDLIHQNINDSISLNNFYRIILQQIRHHRIIDTVYSPINISKIRFNDYNEEYLKTSCYETTSDLLYAHGYNKTDVQLSVNDIQSLLPAILYTIENPGCSRQSLPSKSHSFFDVWILGLLVVFMIKLIHFVIFFIAGDYCLSINSNEHSTIHIHPSSIKFRLWLGLGLNAFTCGLMLGTIIYHLIPHIYDVPNENFDYIYLLRATIVFFGVYLFFIVEKLLRFRFKIDEETHNDNDHLRKYSDTSMIQMARMHATLHASEDDDHPHKHSSPPARIPLHDESEDEETDLQGKERKLSDHNSNEFPNRKRNLILYHLINYFSNDLIYGCGLSTALAHDRLIGLVLCLMIFSEGFRRHSQTISSLGRKHGLYLLLISIVFLLIGYILGGIIVEINRKYDHNNFYIPMEYIYSIVYGALFYTALVSLIPELNNFSHHLQIILKQINQTRKQRRLIKILILICQNLFLIIGVIITLILASIWRYYHRIDIFDYVCKRDTSRIFCHLDLSKVLAINNELTHLENDLLYKHIQTLNDLELFYTKIIQSNNINNLKFLSNNDPNLTQCFKSTNDLLNAFQIQPSSINNSLSSEDIQRILPALVSVKFNNKCKNPQERTSWKNILVGFLAVSFINCSALGGAIILPFRKKPAFKWILSAFIGLAVGTLTGSGIFHLIPMAFNIPNLDIYHSYLKKALITMIAIYLFYIRDQLSRIFLNIETIICTHTHVDDKLPIETNNPIDDSTPKSKKQHLNNMIQNLKTMKAAGWMIFLGDMLHNFIDGLTLGAAFTVSIGEGLRMSLPIACEEFPHELGDIAVLLSSGLTIGQALIVNFLAACSCYIGFFIGIKLGELEEFHPWIYALAGGMFVYIGLADMIPELVSMGDQVEKDYIESKRPITIMLKFKIFLCQNSGVILGIVIMFLLGRYGTNLENLVQL